MTPRTRSLVSELDLAQGWRDVGDGWEGKESTLQPTTWSRARRVVVLRRRQQGARFPRASDVAAAKLPRQQRIADCEPYLVDGDFEHQVLVTSLVHDLPAIAQLYRECADVENVFDEIKNHWGWGWLHLPHLRGHEDRRPHHRPHLQLVVHLRAACRS